MKIKLYAIFDKVAGAFGKVEMFLKDALAERWFTTIVTSPDGLPIKSDIDLYYLGDFDSETGVIEPCDKPVFLMNGGSVDV